MSEEKGAEGKGGGGKGAMIGFLVATLVAAGAGGGMGFVLAPKFAAGAAGHAKEEAAAEEGAKEKEEKIAEPYARDTTLLKLQPVTTNLREPFRSWVRLEGALIVKGAEAEEKALEELAALVQEDVMAYLRTLALKDLEGASNLAFLRDDLNECARLRTEGRVAEFIILSLVVE